MQNHNNFIQEKYEGILKAILTNRFWKPFCLMLIQTGMRINELLVLAWQDIDFERKVIHVNKCTATDGTHQIQQFNNAPLLRSIQLTDEIEQLLNEYKDYRQRVMKNPHTDSLDLVFSNSKGKMRSYSGLSHNFKKFLKARRIDQKVTLNSLKQFASKQAECQKTKQNDFEM